MTQKISIIIPSYNEANYIDKIISKIKKLDWKVLNFNYEIIVVDDGSTDNTQNVLNNIDSIKIINQENKGKGNAVQNGIANSTGDYILIQDADLEYDPSDYYNLLAPLQTEKKISVYGSRPMNIKREDIFLSDKHQMQSYGSYFMNKLLCVMFKNLFRLNLTDPLTGYKVYERNFFLNHRITSEGFEADHEITIKLIKSGYKILEVPIRYNPRSKSEGKKINLLDAFKAMYILVKLKLKF